MTRPPMDERSPKTYICRAKRCGVPCIREFTEPPTGCSHWSGYDARAEWHELVPVRRGGSVTKTRPILYISGPYSSGNGRTVTHNIQIAQEYAAIAWMKGWAAFTPHLNTANFERYCPTVEHSDWLAGDLAILNRLRPGHDAILMLPNWQESAGARREREAAQMMGLIVYYADAIAGGVPEVPE